MGSANGNYVNLRSLPAETQRGGRLIKTRRMSVSGRGVETEDDT